MVKAVSLLFKSASLGKVTLGPENRKEKSFHLLFVSCILVRFQGLSFSGKHL